MQKPCQLPQPQARQGRRQVDDRVLVILFFSERLLGRALGQPPRTAVATGQSGAVDEVDLLRRIEVEAGSVVGVLQQIYLLRDVLEQFVMPHRELEHAVELGHDLVDRATRTHLLRSLLVAILIGLRGETIAEPFEIAAGDRLRPLRPERGDQVHVEHRTVVATRGWRPVTLIAAVLIPLHAKLSERQASALLAQLATARLDQDLCELRLRLLLTQKPRRRCALAAPVRPERLLVLPGLVAPLRIPSLAALALIQPYVAADRGLKIKNLSRHIQCPFWRADVRYKRPSTPLR